MLPPLIDAHFHLWSMTGAPAYPWLRGPAQRRYHGDDTVLRHDYLPADYLADVGGLPVVGAVHVEAGADDAIAEASWLSGVLGELPFPVVHVARTDLGAPGADAQLDELAAMPFVRGIRHILNWHPDPVYSHTDRDGIIDEPVWRNRFARLARLGLSFDLQVFPAQLAAASRLADEFDDTWIVLDHAGMPIERDPEGLAAWRADMGRLASHPRVVVKVSALGTNDHTWTAASIQPIVHETIDAFGPDHVMFASNFPVDGMYSTLERLYAAFDALTESYSAAERDDMFRGTAARFYRL
ncbi:MAG: amidohydrolase family protein [Microbacterium sp.]|uniref:amidohydrolase family protein n=1 Tax=Microbacterium sp. TaxID=51671 RepID=UPI0039E3CB36